MTMRVELEEPTYSLTLTVIDIQEPTLVGSMVQQGDTIGLVSTITACWHSML
jgi:hypothetical protein